MTKAAGIVGSATFLSRIFGFIRDVVIAWFFGAGLSSDAFFVAFRIPNLLRRLFAEGSLSIAFIPVFTEYLTNQGKDEAFHLARSAIRLLSAILVVMVILGILLAPIIIQVIAPGFTDSPEKFSLTVTLTRIMFPYIFFICLVALCMGILNTLGHFAAPALAPVFLNLALIFSAFFIAPYMAEPVTGLAIGVLIGGFLQLGLQLPFLIKKGLYFWQKASFYHPGIKKVGTLMLPAVFGASVYQLNILIGTLLASLLPEGSVSYLYYADRLVQFPLGIFAIATATAVLPSLSRQAAAKDFEAVRDTFGYAMKLVSFITIPSMAGLIVLREPIVALLFKRGAFDIETTRMTAYALLYYSVGLWAFSAVRIVVSTFYALQDTKTPTKIAVISIFANMVLGIILMIPMGHGGLALSTSLASMLNLGLLIRSLRKKLGLLKWRSILKSVFNSVLCSLLMAIFVRSAASLIIPPEHGTVLNLFSGVVISIAVGLLAYGFFSFLTKSQEFEKVLTMAKKGLKKC
ncbi:murein biosynthesis integral membrane protein MurJ [Desulfonema magnum]|nr:murein biosynthesis integral membrane protein MurJ [Desulfonema magnum]